MKPIYIAHKKAECIGCLFCTEMAPHYFGVDENGEAQLIHPIRQDKIFQYAKGFPDDLPTLHQVTEGCPVNIIKIL